MFFNQIITHPGSAHKDDFLACCLLIASCRAPVFRRDPTPADLADPFTAVVDVGACYEPESGNFDHHQFPSDHEPACALSLVLKALNLYDEARQFCEWLETTEWFDARGPVETARWLGVERKVLVKLLSPIDLTMVKRFSFAQKITPGEVLWELMFWVGEDMIAYLKGLKEKLELIEQHSEIWEMKHQQEVFKVLYFPRLNDLTDDPSASLGRYIQLKELDVVGMIYPDRRGQGYGLSRYNDFSHLDFTRLDHCEDVHFAHARGFVAKTTATSSQRLRELFTLAWSKA